MILPNLVIVPSIGTAKHSFGPLQTGSVADMIKYQHLDVSESRYIFIL